MPAAHVSTRSCYNAPEQWQLGWTQQVAYIKNMDAGVWSYYDIPAVSESDTAVLQVWNV